MAIPNIIEKLQNRVNELDLQIVNSANFYNSRDNELKQLLQNHHTLVGQFNEAKTLLDQLTKEQAENESKDEQGTAEHD